MLPFSLLAPLAVALVLLVSGEGVLFNETLSDNVTTEIYHGEVSMTPQASINLTLLSETAHNLSHNYSSNSNITLQINETLLLDDTPRANVTHEDSETFQDQEKYVPVFHCPDAASLEIYNHMYCGAGFQKLMANISKERWCDWEEIVLPYNQLSECMENLAGILNCYYPNQQSQAFFVAMHEIYFRNCQEEEEVPWDAPPSLVLALTLLPVSLIPILVFMVVWKNNVRE